MKTVYGQAGHSPAASHASDGTGDDKRVHRGREATKERARSWCGGLISEGVRGVDARGRTKQGEGEKHRAFAAQDV